MEIAWLDEEIPALVGITPRQAAGDPTRRDDVIRLLNGFKVSPGGFSAERLRADLDLPS